MRAGKLKFRAQVQQKSTTYDAVGHTPDTWTDFPGKPAVWCSVATVSGREIETARRFYASATHVVTTRYHDWITEKHSLVIRGVRYQIGFVEHVDMAFRELRILCSELRA